MMKYFYSIAICMMLTSCAMVQQVIKSSFPYTTTLTIPASAAAGTEQMAISRATSFDQNFVKSGNNATRINNVRIVGAKLQSAEPSDYNLGNLSTVKIYMSKANGTEEVLVASQTDIVRNNGNTLVLNTDNSHFLDEHVREPHVRVRMVYRLRRKEPVDATLKLVLSLTADRAVK